MTCSHGLSYCGTLSSLSGSHLHLSQNILGNPSAVSGTRTGKRDGQAGKGQLDLVS